LVAALRTQPAVRRCLVLGAGLLGSHIARHLADSGYDVDVYSRGLNPWFDETRRQGIDVHIGRIESETELLTDLVEAADCVVHLASSSRPPLAVRAPLVDVEQTITPALIVMQLVARWGKSKLLLSCSSGGTVYGVPSTFPTPETHPLQPTTPYAITHVALEHYLDYYGRAYGLEWITMRFANVYGPGELGRGGQGVVGTWLRQIAIGERPVLFESTSVSRDFIFISDAAAAVAALIDKGRPGTAYNVGSSTTTSLHDLLELVRSVAATTIEPAPGSPAGDCAASLIPMTLLDTTLIREHAGWEPAVDLEEGISRTWEWINDEWLPRCERTDALVAT
jgi:UDP-glucose 4-epimerase